ncbi:MAG: MFS transporter [Candidatus Geothermarchaeales archaeon]
MNGRGEERPILGLRANLGQFLVQMVQVFFVGVTIGLERTVVPVLAKEEFGIASASVILTFIVSFGFVKALLNLYGGSISDRWGRRRVLILGWVAAIPIPLIIIYAPAWEWIALGNVLLGVNQGLAWSMTVTSKIDITKPEEYGIATGFNEFSGYTGVAFGALVTGFIAAAYSPRPHPFYLGLAVILVALVTAVAMVKETRGFALSESTESEVEDRGLDRAPGFLSIFKWVSWKDPAMFAACQAGSIEKFVDTLVWVSFPIYFLSQGLTVAEIGIIVSVYGFTWGVLQLVTGPLSDRIGRKRPIAVGMWVCALGVVLTISTRGIINWVLAAAITGGGMAMLYPALIAAVGDVSQPKWRGTSLGVYRLWRDAGYGFGAISIGLVSDFVAFEWGFYLTALLMVTSGGIVAIRMYETHPGVRARHGTTKTDRKGKEVIDRPSSRIS